MAKPSDLLGEVAAVAAEAVEGSEVYHRGPSPVRIDEVRSRREQAKRVEAMALRLAGLTYEQVGERLGISTDGAQDLVSRTLDRAEDIGVNKLRELEGSRLDRAQAAIWADVLKGDLKAVDTFLRLSGRRAQLFGLNAPTTVNLNVNVRQEMEQALAKLEAMVLGEVIDAPSELSAPPSFGTDPLPTPDLNQTQYALFEPPDLTSDFDA